MRRARGPPLRRQLHRWASEDLRNVLELARRAGDRAVPAAVTAGFGACHAGARRRSAVRVGRRAGDRRRDPRRPAGRSGLPGAPRDPRRSAGGHARLLGLEQGIGLPGRELDALRGPGTAGRIGPPQRRGADAVPRPRRGDRPGRRPDQPRDPCPGARVGRRPAQVHRAGRGRGGPLRQSGHRAPPSRAGRERGDHCLDRRARRREPCRRRTGPGRHGRACRECPDRLPGARLGRPRIRGVLPPDDADRGAVVTPHRFPACRSRQGRARWWRTGPVGRSTDRRSARDPVGLRMVPGACQPPWLVRARVGAGGVHRSPRPGRRRRACRAVPAAGRSSRASSTTPR